MTTFEDTKGRTWRFNLTIGLALRLKEATGFDVMTLSSSETLERMANDVGYVFDVLLLPLQDQLAVAGVSVEQFGQAFDEDTADHAVTALLEAVKLFFPEVEPRDESADRKQPEDSDLTGEQAWRQVFELAAVAGVAPWPYTLRQLKLQADYAAEHAWWHTASVQAMLANTVRDGKKRPKAYTPAEFHPLEQARRRGKDRPKLSKAESVEVLKQLFVHGQVPTGV